MRPSRLPHLLRGSAAAAVATFTALLSHVAADGEMPGWLGVLVPLLLSMMVSVVLAGRRLSLLRLSLSVTVSQFLFHTLFVLGAITPSGMALGHQHGAPLELPAAVGDLALVAPDAGMWLGHALAAGATTLLLYRGERATQQLLHAARTVVGWVVAVLARALVLPVEARPRAARPAPEGDVRSHIALRVVHQLRRRGPPVFSIL